MKKIICLMLSVLIMLPLLACTGSGTGAAINYNLDTEPSSLDPQIASDESAKIVITNLFEGLTRIDSSDNVVPGCASSWQSNNDNTSFTFTLRNDITWSDKNKTSVTARDFLFALKRAILPSTKSSLAKNLFCIKNASAINSGQRDISELGVYCIDDYTLKIDLEYSYEDFPRLMASSVCMPCNEEYFNSCQGQYGLESNKVISNGAFSLASIYAWSHDKSVTLSKNTSYKGTNEAKTAGINFTIGTYYSNNVTAIQNEDIDAGAISSEDTQLAKASDMYLCSFQNTTMGFCFNLKDDTFKNQNIRTALLSSLDREKLVKNLPSSCSRADDIVMPMLSVAGKSYRTLVGGGFGLQYNSDYLSLMSVGLKEANLDSLPSVTILCEDNAVSKVIVSNAIEMLNGSFNVFFNMEAVEKSKLESKLYSGAYQMALTSLSAASNSVSDLFLSFTSSSKSNYTCLNDSNFDTIVQNISLNPGFDSLAYAVEAEKYLNDNAIFYPVCYKDNYYASGKNVKNVVFLPFNSGIDFTFCEKGS